MCSCSSTFLCPDLVYSLVAYESVDAWVVWLNFLMGFLFVWKMSLNQEHILDPYYFHPDV